MSFFLARSLNGILCTIPRVATLLGIVLLTHRQELLEESRETSWHLEVVGGGLLLSCKQQQLTVLYLSRLAITKTGHCKCGVHLMPMTPCTPYNNVLIIRTVQCYSTSSKYNFYKENYFGLSAQWITQLLIPPLALRRTHFYDCPNQPYYCVFPTNYFISPNQLKKHLKPLNITKQEQTCHSRTETSFFPFPYHHQFLI